MSQTALPSAPQPLDVDLEYSKLEPIRNNYAWVCCWACAATPSVMTICAWPWTKLLEIMGLWQLLWSLAALLTTPINTLVRFFDGLLDMIVTEIVPERPDTRCLVGPAWFEGVSQVLLQIPFDHTRQEPVVATHSFSYSPSRDATFQIDQPPFSNSKNESEFYRQLLQIFLNLPKTRRGHVQTSKLLSRVRKRQIQVWDPQLSEPAKYLLCLCFHYWQQDELCQARTVSLDDLWSLSLAWERDKDILNYFKYPAKVFYNESVRYYHALEHPVAQDLFTTGMQQLMGRAWHSALLPGLHALFHIMKRRETVLGFGRHLLSGLRQGDGARKFDEMDRVTSYESLNDYFIMGSSESDETPPLDAPSTLSRLLMFIGNMFWYCARKLNLKVPRIKVTWGNPRQNQREEHEYDENE